MSFNSNPGRAEYVAASGQTLFTYVFKVYVSANLKVYLTPVGQAPSDVNDLLTETMDYTVSINGDAGGSITLLDPATSGDAVTLKRDLENTRNIEYQELGDLFAETLNIDQNYQTYLISDQETSNDKFLSIPQSAQGVSNELPSPEALKLLGWNPSANAIQNYTIVEDGVAVNILTVDTISDMLLVPTDIYSTVNVKRFSISNNGGGGIFNYDPAQSSINDGGIIIDGWVRQFNGQVSAVYFGAVGDNSANNDSVFFTIEALQEEVIYLPKGIFKTTSAGVTLTKNYIGEGSIDVDNLTIGGKTPEQLVPRVQDRRYQMNSSAFTGDKPRPIVFIGDSITFGTGGSFQTSYPIRLLEILNANNNRDLVPTGILTGATQLGYQTSSAGVTLGTKGPLGRSSVIPDGDYIEFVGTDSNNIGCFVSSSGTTGDLNVTMDGVLEETFLTSGATTEDQRFTRETRNSPATLRFTATGGAVEITGLWGHNTFKNGDILLQTQGAIGYSVASFTNDMITAIKAQAFFQDSTENPTYVIALGTNDMTSASLAVPSATFEANLENMVGQLASATSSVMLTVPLRSTEQTYPNVFEPFDNYRDAVYRVARKNKLTVIDLSEIDFSDVGYTGDGLHPSFKGYQMLAGFYAEKIFNINQPKQETLGLQVIIPITAPAVPKDSWGTPTATRVSKHHIVLTGAITTNTATLDDTEIARVPKYMAPPSLSFYHAQGLEGLTLRDVIITVDIDGIIKVFRSSGTLTEIFFNNVSWIR